MTQEIIECKKCGERLPLDNYYDHPETKTKKQPKCKKCMNEDNLKAFQNNKQKYKERLKAWRAANPEKYKAELERRKEKRKKKKEGRDND